MLKLPMPQIPCRRPARSAYRGILRDLRKRRLSSPKPARWWSFSGATAQIVGRLVGVEAKASADFAPRLRQFITVRLTAVQVVQAGGKIKVDDGEVGGRLKDTQRRGAARKDRFSNILTLGSTADDKVFPAPCRTRPMPAVRRDAAPGVVGASASLLGYKNLETSGGQHERIDNKTDFARGARLINGIETFWSSGKRHPRGSRLRHQRCPGLACGG